MPHVDELLAPATLAAADLAVVVVLHAGQQTPPREPRVEPASDVVTTHSNARVVRLPAVEVIGRRSASVAAPSGPATPPARRAA